MTVAIALVALPDGMMSYPSPAAFEVTAWELPSTRAPVMVNGAVVVRCSGLPAPGQLYTDAYSFPPDQLTAPHEGSATMLATPALYTAALCPLAASHPPIPRSRSCAAAGTLPVWSGPMLSR